MVGGAWVRADGYDPSAGLLTVARRLHPGVLFAQAALPQLYGLDEANFANVLCETVIMHVPPSAIEASVRRLLSILEPGGTRCISWRVTDQLDYRDDLGRLYSAFAPDIPPLLQNSSATRLSPATMLEEHTVTSASSGRTVHRVIARKVHHR